MSIRAFAGLVVLALLPLQRLAPQQLSATDRAQLAATVWSGARYNFASWAQVRADWDSALAASLRIAMQPQSDLLFHRRLRQLVALLGDAQADVVPPAALRSRIARPPLLLVSVERRPFVLDYAENDEMRVARPQRLGEILAVQGIPVEAWIRDSILPQIGAATPAARWERAITAMLEGEKGSALHLLLRLPGGEQGGISVTRSISLNDRWPLERHAVEVDSLPDRVIVARLNTLADPEVIQQFDRMLPTFSGVRGLIVDLRNVATGRREFGYQILARLTPRPFGTALRRTPGYRPGLRMLGPPIRSSPGTDFPPTRSHRGATVPSTPARLPLSVRSVPRVRPKTSWLRSVIRHEASSSARLRPAARGRPSACRSSRIGTSSSRQCGTRSRTARSSLEPASHQSSPSQGR